MTFILPALCLDIVNNYVSGGGESEEKGNYKEN